MRHVWHGPCAELFWPERTVDMMIAGGVVEVAPGAAEEVFAELERIPKVTPQGIFRSDYVVVVMEGFDLEQLQRLRRFLLEELAAVRTVTAIEGAFDVGSALEPGGRTN